MNFSGFSGIPMIDSHVHLVHPERLEEMLAILEEVGAPRANLVCLPNPDATTHNPAALLCKRQYPERFYISGALDYTVLSDPQRAPALLGAQIAGLKAQGFDGLKLIEGKPQVRKLLPYPLDGDLYAEVWAALEREAFPVVLHINDPEEFWDAARCPFWARQSGWDYSDGTYPAREDLYGEVERILARCPGLKMTLAHFAFLSDDLERAARLLEAYPGVSFDLAPHMQMYRHFSQAPAAARAFFLRYQERILYGTDIDTRALARGAQELMRFIPWLVRALLETDGPFTTAGGETYQGLGLPRPALENIYHANFERLYGAQPARL